MIFTFPFIFGCFILFIGLIAVFCQLIYNHIAKKHGEYNKGEIGYWIFFICACLGLTLGISGMTNEEKIKDVKISISMLESEKVHIKQDCKVLRIAPDACRRIIEERLADKEKMLEIQLKELLKVKYKEDNNNE